MSENWLLIETSGRVGRVGLARGDAVRAVSLDAARRHARDLTATVDGLLSADGLTPADLSGVMVGVGPGSYTGLRVGLMTAKALAYAAGFDLVAVPTFAAVAEQTPGRPLWVIADALQGLVYAQRFAGDAGELRIEPFEAFLAKLTPGEWVSGPGLAAFASRLPAGVNLAAETDRDPTTEGLFRAGRRLAAVSREELFRLEPLYLRGSSAEEKAKADAQRPV